MRIPRYMIVIAVFLASFSLGLVLPTMRNAQQAQSSEKEQLKTISSLPEALNESDAWRNDLSSSYLPNIPLHTHDGRDVRFYDDLVKNKSVIVNFMYTRCGGICPLATLSLAKVHRLLGNRMGRDIQMLSISLDPEEDTPEELKRYAEAWGNKQGWTYLTGSLQDVTLLRRRMGLYDPDASVDAENISHTSLVTFGNDKTGRWATLPAALESQELAQAILRVARPMENSLAMVQKSGRSDETVR